MLSDSTGQDHAAAGSHSTTCPVVRCLRDLRNSRAEKPLLFPPWISDIVGAADLLLAMVLGSVLLLGRRSGGGSVLSTRRQRPTRGGRDDGKRPGRAGADDPFQPGEINRFAYSVIDFGGFGGECPS
jgi:hypothetical protein